MATGFHGAHVLIGTIFLFVCLIRASNGHFSPEKHIGFEAAAWYWHFVDVVWLFLFLVVYIWGGESHLIKIKPKRFSAQVIMSKIKKVVAPTLFGFFGVSLLLCLCFWQVGRLEWKQELLELIDKKLNALSGIFANKCQ